MAYQPAPDFRATWVGYDPGEVERYAIVALPYTPVELTALMREIESDRVERKRSAADRSGIRRNLCARRGRDQPFDLRQGAAEKLDDLDLDFLRIHYLPSAIAPDVLLQNRRPLDRQLHSLRLLDGGRPTWGALLAFGRDPQRWVPGAWVQFLRVDGASITDPIRDQKALTGRLDDVLRRLDELFTLNVSVRTEVAGRPREVQQPDYPVAALQQLGWNAVMHRSYEGTHAPTRVYWYADRIEMTSPGGLYGRVTSENFGRGVTDYRNSLVAEIMHHLGFGQRFGLGVPLASEALRDNGNPPATFDFEPTQVSVTLRPAG